MGGTTWLVKCRDDTLCVLQQWLSGNGHEIYSGDTTVMGKIHLST